jgi:hypothetical protein
MRNVSDKSCRENQNTIYIQLVSSENRTVHEMSKNIEEPEIPETIWRMRVA